MSERKSMAALLERHYNSVYFQVLAEICQEIIENQPEAEQMACMVFKEYRYKPADLADDNRILFYGYGQKDFLGLPECVMGLLCLPAFLWAGYCFL